MTEHRYANTAAALMLAAGLRSAAHEHGLSLREIGRRLGYKQPVVLSHMAHGRVPIPIDRAAEIAQHVGMPADRFLEAVLHQHHPEVPWELVTGTTDSASSDLERALGKRLSTLTAEQHRILREVTTDSRPEERWLSTWEVATVRFLRERFPRFQREGLATGDREFLETLEWPSEQEKL